MSYYAFEYNDALDAAIQRLRVAELRDICRSVGLPSSGTKVQLVAKVRDDLRNRIAHHRNNEIPAYSTPTAAPNYKLLYTVFKIIDSVRPNFLAQYWVQGGDQHNPGSNNPGGLQEQNGSSVGMKRTAPDELNDSLAKRPKVVSSPMPGQQMYHAQTMGTPAHYMPPPNAVPRVPGYTELPQNVQESLASSEDPFFDSPQLPPICGFLMEGATGHQTQQAKSVQFMLTEEQHKQLNSPNGYRAVLRTFICTKPSHNRLPPKHSWPSGTFLFINTRFVDLAKCKRDEKKKTLDMPADISSHLVPGANKLTLQTNTLMPYYISLQFMKQVSVEELVNVVKTQRVISVEQGRQLILQSFGSSNDDVLEMKKKISLNDPLLLTRIQLPTRPKNCKHLSVFDLDTYLRMNERIRTWRCPVCSQMAYFEDLYIDQFWSEVLSQLGEDESEVEVHPDGTWTRIKWEPTGVSSEPNSPERGPSSLSSSSRTHGARKEEVLVLDDSDDESHPPPATSQSTIGPSSTAPASSSTAPAPSSAAPAPSSTAPNSTVPSSASPGLTPPSSVAPSSAVPSAPIPATTAPNPAVSSTGSPISGNAIPTAQSNATTNPAPASATLPSQATPISSNAGANAPSPSLQTAAPSSQSPITAVPSQSCAGVPSVPIGSHPVNTTAPQQMPYAQYGQPQMPMAVYRNVGVQRAPGPQDPRYYVPPTGMWPQYRQVTVPPARPKQPPTQISGGSANDPIVLDDD